MFPFDPVFAFPLQKGLLLFSPLFLFRVIWIDIGIGLTCGFICYLYILFFFDPDFLFIYFYPSFTDYFLFGPMFNWFSLFCRINYLWFCAWVGWTRYYWEFYRLALLFWHLYWWPEYYFIVIIFLQIWHYLVLAPQVY